MSIKSKIKHLVNASIRRGNWFKNEVFKDCSKFWTYDTFNTDVVNLGSSSGVHAFCYEDIPLKAANWAMGPNPILGDLAILKNYCSYLNPHSSTVIMPLCPFTSLAGSYDYFDDRYYTILYCSTIPYYSFRREQKAVQRRNNPVREYPLLSFCSDIKIALFGSKKPILNDEQMEKDALCRLDSWMKEFNISNFDKPLSLINKDSIDDAIRILNETISFCKERNMKPVILIPPVYHTLGEHITQSIRSIVIDPLIEGIEDKSVWFHNYMDDASFSFDISLFENSFFLNKKGAKLFTKRVLCDIGLIKL